MGVETISTAAFSHPLDEHFSSHADSASLAFFMQIGSMTCSNSLPYSGLPVARGPMSPRGIGSRFLSCMRSHRNSMRTSCLEGGGEVEGGGGVGVVAVAVAADILGGIGR